MEIDSEVFIPAELSKYLILDVVKEPSPQLKTLLNLFKQRRMISDRVYEVMIKVDRKNFINDDTFHSPYADMPRPIGFNTTISAPGVHAETLQRLQEALRPGARALDIGTGSGFIAACFAEMVGKDGKVFMLDHLPQILELARNNIKKGNPILLKQKRIVSVLQDGRKGLP